MKKLIIISLALTLTACGEGSVVDESFKASFREKLVMTCAATAEGKIPAGVIVDIDQLCTCAADKVMEGKSAKDLVTTIPGSAEDMAKLQTCLTELAPVKVGPARTPEQ